MLIPIENVPRDYAWGSVTAIPALVGREPSGRPEAELWLGAHPGSPARVVGSDRTLLDLLEGGRLPFLLKLLAAGGPLSLQAHPTMAQAAEGFERENALGIPLDAPNRNYRDAFHKPELIYALSPTFDALCGFRSIPKTKEILARLGAAAEPLAERLVDENSLRPAFSWLISRGDGVDELVERITDAARERVSPSFSDDLGLVPALADAYPGDPGVVIALLLNRVTLQRGEVLYLPAGNIHAYLDGLGVELMAASDNVLRGGLTPKHVDVPELERVLDFRSLPVPYLAPLDAGFGVEAFRPDVPDFELLHTVTDAAIDLAGPAIALCTAGRFTAAGHPLAPGDALFVDGEPSIDVAGEGDLFIATTSIATALEG
ncbi:mannose-6-phosphate isomerase, class I [Galbitalea sp. SE-J8]|uniref:mannose-6-phosphate isomerase, class I n=1 Tax=Galbitalea sp. SE-J8 TaxID=3054952 RepID=UPI00259CAB13|nr:mannose-6-phosphate isomerase, class I [Galbitalea sp. SE-J8]MDM4762721.1 mannose-6-phosphate isomerase, class I [Galbitalea sp. SE-J8]